MTHPSLMPWLSGFHGDQHLVHLVDRLLDHCRCFLDLRAGPGIDLAHVARNNPGVPCIAAEPRSEWFEEALARAAWHRHVFLYEEEGESLLRRLAGAWRPLVRPPVLVHWSPRGEWDRVRATGLLRSVAERFPDSKILINQIEVPGQPEFQYLRGSDGGCTQEFLQEVFAEHGPVWHYAPSYTPHAARHEPLTGWSLLDLGAENADLQREFPAVLTPRQHLQHLTPRLSRPAPTPTPDREQSFHLS